MFNRFAAVLLATALVAGPALAAQPAGGAANPPAAATTAKVSHAVKPAVTVRHVRKHVAHHAKPAKMHHARVAKTGKAGVKIAKLHAVRNSIN
jgi:hypothetical protein